ncbi:MAG: SDR family NAD(P)-dependent oxidoreductase, partial [Chloroflexota bacterium]|nr:SDR family NAD(P)-dependent oxidoreductase [Chloroflexota bacterium]
MAEGKLSGQVAIVTGASSGIGRATAYALADEGAKVALVARSADVINAMAAEIVSKGGTAIAYAADVADAAAVERFVANVVHEWGRIDLL